jgi:hypothetical protein
MSAQVNLLRDEIVARADCAAAVTARDIDTIAALISAGRMATQSRYVTARTVLADCGLIGASILDSLEAAAAGNSAVKWAVKFLGQDSGIDVGNPATQYMIGQLQAAGALTQAQADALKELALQPAPVTRAQVSAALYNADGTQK